MSVFKFLMITATVYGLTSIVQKLAFSEPTISKLKLSKHKKE